MSKNEEPQTLDLENLNIESYIEHLEDVEECSQLGFFSKPYKVKIEGSEVIIKRYIPTKKNVKQIVSLHNRYVDSLRSIGIKVPDTHIAIKKDGDSKELLIAQLAFKEDELLRDNFERKSIEELCRYLKLMYDEAILFWNKSSSVSPLGFHPTLRNYAIRNDTLYYFDTFPPMNLAQSDLNQLILQMSPIIPWMKFFIPARTLKIVSNEYYDIEKMLMGILGSSVRLRPELGREILDFTLDYMATSDLSVEIKERLVRKMSSLPRLSLLWRFVRKITGNVGQPNTTLKSTSK